MIGMAMKKVNSAALRLSVPSSSAPTIVAPERDTPGTSASIWNEPDKEAEVRRVLVDVGVFRLEPQLVDIEQHDAADDQHRRR